MQYTWDRYCSICSSIKFPLEITAGDYFVASNGAVYDAIKAAYIVLRIMGYIRASCLPSTIILPASFCLPICMCCSICLKGASVQLEIHSPENTNMITDVWAHTCTTFQFISKFNASIYDGKICLFSYWSGEINKQTNSLNS